MPLFFSLLAMSQCVMADVQSTTDFISVDQYDIAQEEATNHAVDEEEDEEEAAENARREAEVFHPV